MNSPKHNPSLSKLTLPNGLSLLDQHRPRYNKPDSEESASIIYIVRHGEKYFDDSLGKLNEQGWERAFALAAQMSLNSLFQDTYQEMEIIAAASPDGSHQPDRYVETAIPFAMVNNKQIKVPYKHSEYEELAEYLKSVTNKRIFIFWEHKHMHNLVRALGFNEQDTPYYPTEDFSQIWKITNLTKLEFYSQNLMYNDAFHNFSKEEILTHSLQIPTPNQYPHGSRYSVTQHFKIRSQSNLECPFDCSETNCESFYFEVFDYDRDLPKYVDACVTLSRAQDFDKTKMLFNKLQGLLENGNDIFDNENVEEICEIETKDPVQAQVDFTGLSGSFCRSIQAQLEIPGGEARSNSLSQAWAVTKPLLLPSLLLGSFIGGVYLRKKCLKKRTYQVISEIEEVSV